MAIDFPNSPSVGATYTVGNLTWTFSGVSWDLSAAGIQGIQGIQGPTGLQGLQGASVQGTQGIQGSLIGSLDGGTPTDTFVGLNPSYVDGGAP